MIRGLATHHHGLRNQGSGNEGPTHHSHLVIQVIILSGFCLFLYFMNLGKWDLWNPDEPRYGQVARELIEGGDWILMHFNGNPYPDKPPVFFWLIAFCSFFWSGLSSFSVRFPAAFFGTLTVLVTFFLGKALYSSRAGFLSGLILATSFEFAHLSTRANIDTTLTFFTTGSLFCFFLWYRQVKAEARVKVEEKAKMGNPSIYGFYVGMALATLTKGPVGFILPLLVSLIYLVFQRDWKAMMKMRFVTGMALFSAMVLSWYLPAVLRGGEDYLHATLLFHTVERFSKGVVHSKPIYYYLFSFPGQFLPWVLFLPSAIGYGFSKKTIEARRDFLFLFVWFVVIFLFFSLSKGKRPLYLLPLFPSVSLIVGKFWDDFMSGRHSPFKEKWISFPLHAVIFLLPLSAVIVWLLSEEYPIQRPGVLLLALLSVGGSMALVILYRLKRYGLIFFLITAVAGGAFFYVQRSIFPLLNPYRSARFICEELMSTIRPGEPVATFGLDPGPYLYYTGIVPVIVLNREEALATFLRSQGRVFCFIRSRDLEKIQEKDKGLMVKLAVKNRIGREDVVLVSNR